MARRAMKPTLLFAVGALGLLGLFGYFQHAALGEPAGSVGTIEGTVDNPLIATDTAVVYLKDVPGVYPPPKEGGTMSQKKITFNPKVLAVQVGSKVLCPNDDTVTHNIFSPQKSAKAFTFGLYPPGSNKELELTKVGVVPFLCNIHAEMGAFCVVCPNPFFAKTEKDGKFKIENVPVGTYKITFWHEKLKPKTVEVTVTAGKTETVNFNGLDKGKYSIDLLK